MVVKLTFVSMPVTVDPVAKFAHQVRSATTKSAQRPLVREEISFSTLVFPYHDSENFTLRTGQKSRYDGFPFFFNHEEK